MRFNKDAIIYCMVQGIGALLILWLCLHLVGCKTIQQQTAVHNRDSVRVEVRLRDTTIITEPDSATLQALFECDSTNHVVLSQLIALQGERIKTDIQTKQKPGGGISLEVKCHEDSLENIIHMQDSIISSWSSHSEVVTQTISVPRPRTGYDRFCSWFFWIVVVLLLLLAGFWICDKIPATKPYTTDIKMFLRI